MLFNNQRPGLGEGLFLGTLRPAALALATSLLRTDLEGECCTQALPLAWRCCGGGSSGESHGPAVGRGVCSPYVSGWGGKLEDQGPELCYRKSLAGHPLPRKGGFLCQTLVTSRKLLGGNVSYLLALVGRRADLSSA